MKLDKLIGKYQEKVTAQPLSMYTAFLKRFGENLKKNVPRILFMPPFEIQTGGQNRLGVASYIVLPVLVSGPSTYQAQYHSIYNDIFFKKSRFLQV